jgi:hypothetical protein
LSADRIPPELVGADARPDHPIRAALEKEQPAICDCGRGNAMTLSFTACLVSVLLHELAHVATAKALGVRVKRVGFSWKGPYIVREAGTPEQNMCISLAGPAANALLMYVPGLFLINLALLVPNLVMKESDGRRAWNCWQAIAVRGTCGRLR